MVRSAIGLMLALLLPEASFAQDGGESQVRTSLAELLGVELAERYEKIIDADEQLSWEVYFPASDSQDEPGVLIYISPTMSGRIDPRWRDVMDAQNMIYISANQSGNRVRTIVRMVMAVMSVKALGQVLAFDSSRIFVSGFSGGGRVASRVATQYPETISGALYICGVDLWEAKHTPNIERALRNRYVFLTGSRDFNRAETRRIHKRYVEAGAENTRLMVIRGMAHALPGAEALDEALAFLNGAAN